MCHVKKQIAYFKVKLHSCDAVALQNFFACASDTYKLIELGGKGGSLKGVIPMMVIAIGSARGD